MKSIRERYNTDANFKALVDMMIAHIDNCYFTPSEMREAAILASIIYEEHNISRLQLNIIEEDIEIALRRLRYRIEEIKHAEPR